MKLQKSNYFREDLKIMIAIGCDHGGLGLKNEILKHLTEKGLEVRDFGVDNRESCDYPDIAVPVCNAIKNGECESGILVCGTGIGMSIAANKVNGIRAAHVTDTFSARMAREHNNAHIICLGERITGAALALDIVDAFYGSEFLGGNHARRLEKIAALEK